jgi:hypothetical protein
MTVWPEREPWDDAAIDRALREGVSVDPSPAFRARLRARIELEPVPTASRAWLAWPGLAAAAAWVALAIAPGWHADDRTVTAVRPDVPSPVRTIDATEPSIRPAAVPDGAGESPRVRQAVGRGHDALPGVAVHFDPREREAFSWFVSLTADSTMPAPHTLAAVTGDGDVVVAPIEIPAIDVAPAVVADIEADTEEGEPRS